MEKLAQDVHKIFFNYLHALYKSSSNSVTMIIPFLNKATLFMVSPLISKTSKKNISQIKNSDQTFFLLLYNYRITCTFVPCDNGKNISLTSLSTPVDQRKFLD